MKKFKFELVNLTQEELDNEKELQKISFWENHESKEVIITSETEEEAGMKMGKLYGEDNHNFWQSCGECNEC